MAEFKCSGSLFRGTINIYTTAGATVTAVPVGTQRAYTAVANVGGLATISVERRGTYTIASTGTTRLGHASVVSGTPVTAHYLWEKWNCSGYYSFVYTEYLGNINYYSTTGGIVQLTNYRYRYAHRTYDTPTYDASQGIVFQNAYHMQEYRECYINSGGEESSTATKSWGALSDETNSTIFTECYEVGGLGYGLMRNASSGERYGWYMMQRQPSHQQSAPVYRNRAMWNYTKGSTQYANVTGITLTTYPSNNRKEEDGYWYIAI